MERKSKKSTSQTSVISGSCVIEKKSSKGAESVALRRERIRSKIKDIPSDRLKDVEDFINNILIIKGGSLRGVLSGLGFEKIDIEKTIRANRKAMLKGMLDKYPEVSDAESKRKHKGFNARKFAGKLKGVFGDPVKYQRKLRG